MKKFILFLFCLMPLFCDAQENQSQLNLTVHNIGTGTWYYGSPSGFYITNAVFYCDGSFMHGSYETLSSVIGTIAAGISPTYNVTFSGSAADGYGCLGSYVQYVMYATSNSVILQPPLASWNNNYYSSAAQALETLNVIVDGTAVAITNYPVFTNYTGTVVNNLGVTGVASWYYDGFLVQTETLAPGQSGSYTTPPIEVSPVPQLYTFTASINSVGNAIGYNTDGTPNFTAGSTGGGDSTTLTGSGSSQTNTLTGNGTSGGGSATVTTNGVSLASGTNSEVVIGTNVVSWSPPTGVASESTLEAAATLAHSDSVNLLQGEAVLHGDLGVVTNELGQLIGGVSSNNILSVNADTYLNQIATNTARAATNQSSLVISNLTLTVSNAPLTFSNYATATTQLGDSNTLSQMLATNSALLSLLSSGQSNGSTYSVPADGTNYDAALATVSSRLAPVITQWQANQSQITGPNYTEGQDTPDDMTLAIGTFGLIDFNPLHNSGVASIFALAKKFIAWLLVFAYLGKVITDTLQTVRWLTDGKTRTVAPMDAELLGSGGNVVGVSMSLLGSVVVMVVWAVVLGTVLTWTISGFDVFGTFNSNPLTGGPKGSVGLAESFFPFGLFFALATSYLIWRMTYGLALLLGLAVMRMMFGG